jgi:GDP-L-fucose synthase
MKKNIFITGSSGYIGRNLTEQLNNYHNVFYEDHKNLDLLNTSKVESYFNHNKIDVVIHCASHGVIRKEIEASNSLKIIDDNLRMFFNLSRCVKNGMQMYVLGSGAEYNKNNPLKKVSEDQFDRSVPTEPYGFSKYVISKFVEKTDNITSLRLFGVYGKYENYTFRFISNSLIKYILRLPIVINQNVVFDYLYIDDLVSILKFFIDNPPKRRILNVTPTESIDLVSIANIINTLDNYQTDVIVLNEGYNKEYSGDNSKLLDEINNLCFTQYRDGIRELYKYYVKNFDNIDTTKITRDPYLEKRQKVKK